MGRVVGDFLGLMLKGDGSGMGAGELVASWSRVSRGFLRKLLKGAEVRWRSCMRMGRWVIIFILFVIKIIKDVPDHFFLTEYPRTSLFLSEYR